MFSDKQFWKWLILWILLIVVLIVLIYLPFHQLNPIQKVIGSIIGSMISAGAALFVFYRQNERQRKQDEEKKNKEIIEKEKRQSLYVKRINYIKEQIGEEAQSIAIYIRLIRNRDEKNFDHIRDNKKIIDSYIEELDKFNQNMLIINQLDEYMEMIRYLRDWERETNINQSLHRLDLLEQNFFHLADKFIDNKFH
ncbi:hypothetical protein [Sporolactobacillus putidus]|uniref:Uncharacterized protein n=1 Tax=Sporolactobacillus putidus TaxID=492735 RepID=A0A917W2M9_9BACL|nr:hypothetical protein [Sporolactobacillus putidus]GGL55703.1 hypothetical protein GCM10007968_19780 [Sporolactobacillus putidus]